MHIEDIDDHKAPGGRAQAPRVARPLTGLADHSSGPSDSPPSCARRTCARLGGDVFAVLGVDTEPQQAHVLAGRLRATVATPFAIEEQAITVTAAIGGERWPRGAVERVQFLPPAAHR